MPKLSLFQGLEHIKLIDRQINKRAVWKNILDASIETNARMVGTRAVGGTKILCGSVYSTNKFVGNSRLCYLVAMQPDEENFTSATCLESDGKLTSFEILVRDAKLCDAVDLAEKHWSSVSK